MIGVGVLGVGPGTHCGVCHQRNRHWGADGAADGFATPAQVLGERGSPGCASGSGHRWTAQRRQIKPPQLTGVPPLLHPHYLSIEPPCSCSAQA